MLKQFFYCYQKENMLEVHTMKPKVTSLTLSL